MSRRAVDWLVAAQNPDGGWGGDMGIESSIEETALALHACAAHAALAGEAVIRRASQFLASSTAQGSETPPRPIGFYFASLWYFEELYPLIFATAAMRRVAAPARSSDETQEAEPE
jgi:squalene-hopene/tetraprenyl-beta-curcumene cyclase